MANVEILRYIATTILDAMGSDPSERALIWEAPDSRHGQCHIGQCQASPGAATPWRRILWMLRAAGVGVELSKASLFR